LLQLWETVRSNFPPPRGPGIIDGKHCGDRGSTKWSRFHKEKIFSQLLKITISLFTHLHKVLVYIKWSRYELAGNILGRSYVSVHKYKTAVEWRIGGRSFRRTKIIIAFPLLFALCSLSSLTHSFVYLFAFSSRTQRVVLDAS
jgi:hypothetical protein